jgi:hypothetical protein
MLPTGLSLALNQAKLLQQLLLLLPQALAAPTALPAVFLLLVHAFTAAAQVLMLGPLQTTAAAAEPCGLLLLQG